jgi:hypothetical protein
MPRQGGNGPSCDDSAMARPRLEVRLSLRPRSGARKLSSALLKLSLVVLGLALAAPGQPVVAAGSVPARAFAASVAAPEGDFSMNLYRDGDFVSQYTAYWCIGASMQMMLNIVGVTDDEGRAAQENYMRVAQKMGTSRRRVDRSEAAEPGAGGLRGAGSGGWARGLVALGAGAYAQKALDDYDAALRAAAYALRTTGRPVGLIVWRGVHAWVLSGFTATADPLTDPDYRVTGVYIQDPWYPRVSSIWGAGQKPNSWISSEALKSDFLPRRAGRWHPELAGKFVLVSPVDVTQVPLAWRVVQS